MIRRLLPIVALTLVCGSMARAQEAPPPAYLSAVEGTATLMREGDTVAATVNMPFVPGDRLRTENGRVQVMFPDGSAIEVDAYSEIECISPTRVRLIAGTMDHLQRDATRSLSAQYLPQELDVYGTTLDQNGAWQYEAPYGYVWYPTVAQDWRPYYQGYWSPVRSYGWTWVGVDQWAWPTHHYGRWGHASNRWFWIPGRTWGPAWVSWASAGDYVSWCPLGFDSRPVFALSIGQRNSWAGWTVLPRAHFGSHQYYAHRYAIDSRRIPVNTPFIAHSTPPIPTAHASRARLSTGRAASGGGVAVPRQAPNAGRQATSDGRPATIPGRQPSAGLRQPPADNRQTPNDARQPNPGWSRNPQSGVDTHYGTGVPRTMIGAPPAGGQRTAPDYQPPTPEYRPAVPGYRSPNEYRIQRMDPRVASPAPHAAPPPASPSTRPAPAPMAVPRSMTPPPPPAINPPAQAAPQAAPPPARSAPRGQAPQGEAKPRGEARPAEGRRPR